MTVPLPTLRLSPKNQVTLLKGARALVGAEQDGYVCGTTHRMQRQETGVWYPVIVLMTEQELHAREQAIRGNPDLDPVTAEAHIARLNGNVQRMSIDSQRRIVLPKHFVDYLQLDRDVYMFSTNTTVLAWRPEDWLAWSGAEDEMAGTGPGGPPPLLVI